MADLTVTWHCAMQRGLYVTTLKCNLMCGDNGEPYPWRLSSMPIVDARQVLRDFWLPMTDVPNIVLSARARECRARVPSAGSQPNRTRHPILSNSRVALVIESLSPSLHLVEALNLRMQPDTPFPALSCVLSSEPPPMFQVSWQGAIHLQSLLTSLPRMFVASMC